MRTGAWGINFTAVKHVYWCMGNILYSCETCVLVHGEYTLQLCNMCTGAWGIYFTAVQHVYWCMWNILYRCATCVQVHGEYCAAVQHAYRSMGNPRKDYGGLLNSMKRSVEVYNSVEKNV